MIATDERKVPTSPAGYALEARCGKGHSGNHDLYPDGRGYWECAGCLAYYTDAQLLDYDSHGLDVGQGGVIRR